MAEQDFGTKKVHCSTCAGATTHRIVAHRTQTGEDDGVSWGTTHEMLECGGCDTVHLMSTTWCSEWGPDEEQIQRYPPAVSRSEPKWLSKLDSDVVALFEEVYAALHADSRRLATMGARTLLDIF